MLKNHLTIAWRSLKKQPFFTSLNIFGLAIGMTGALLISLYIYDELSFDTMFPDSSRIYRLDSDIKFGGRENDYAEVSAPMAGVLQRDFPQVEETTRFRGMGSLQIRKSTVSTNVKELHAAYADSTLFTMLDLPLLHGDPATALTQPNSLVLTRTAAEKHFSPEQAIGQSVTLNNSEVYTVTGVLEDLPKNSFLREHTVFLSMAGYPDSRVEDWGSNNYYTLVKLLPNARFEDFKASLNGLLESHVMPWAQVYFPGITLETFLASGNYLRFGATPLQDIHLYSDRESEISANSSIQNVYILFFIALFLILLASINFMNLSTAYSLKRAKEVGIRKTLGSNKIELIRQFLVEAGLISFISVAFALLLAAVLLPYFNDLAGKEIRLPFNQPYFWLTLFGSTLVLGLMSGSYPAFFMSRFIPVKVLKGEGKSNVGSGQVRNTLVIFQFAISIFLIVSTLVIFQQLRYMQTKELGYSKDQVLLVEDLFPIGEKVQSFKEEVARLSSVKDVTLSNYFPTPSSRTNSSYFPEGKTGQEDALNMQNWAVDYNYLPTLGLELIAGRNFSRDFPTDSTALILNETALKILDVSPEEAIGLRIIDNFGEQGPPRMLTVIGVVRDFHFDTLRKEIEALSLSYGNYGNILGIKASPLSLPKMLEEVEQVWDRIVPGQPFTYYFMESSFQDTYRSEQRLGKIFMTFTLLSILIACLGLFGLAAFNAEKRTKEIGIRKVMGASVSQIAYRLTIDFLRLVLVSIAVSLPLGWFAMNEWLDDFSYRVDIGWWVFGLAALGAILISVITVSYQGIKAAIVNPVKSLRAE